MDSVRSAAIKVNDIAKEHSGLDVLVNNAGIFLFPDDRTDDGFEIQMQVNHLSHFLLTKLVFESLQNAADVRGEARIVNHSSVARFTGLQLTEKFFERSEKGTLGGDLLIAKLNRYHMTKLCNSLFSMALHEKLQKTGNVNIKALVA